MNVAIVSTHPIQYHTPWFRELAAQKRLNLKVYYALLPDERQQGVGFGEAFAWDIPLLEGYNWELLPNKRKSPSLGGFFRNSTPAIYSRLAEANPDVLIITGWQSLPLLQALWSAVRLGIPTIVRGDSNALRPRPTLVRMLHRLLLSRFSAFLTTGKLNRDFYLQYGVNEERIFSVPHFVDNRRFAVQHQRDIAERQALRAKWNIEDGRRETGDGRPMPSDRSFSPSPVSGPPSSSICFLFAGKLEPKKRIMDLLRAMEIARANDGRPKTDDRREPPVAGPRSSVVPPPVAGPRSSVVPPVVPPIHLLVAGTGELMEEARQFAETRRLPVTFAGFLNQTEITRAYAAADCLVLPSDYGETWGLVVNEAMACGLPAIVSDRVGCAPDLVEEGVTGSVFPCGDIEALASRLVEFASDPEKLARMGEQAKLRIADYSVDAAVAGTMRAIEFVTEEDRRRATADRKPTGDGRRPTGDQKQQTAVDRLPSSVSRPPSSVEP